MDEMFTQGDVEKKVGVSVSSFSDRDVVTPQKAQLAYLIVIVAPIMNSYSVTLPQIQQEVIDEGLDANRLTLQAKVTQTRRVRCECRPTQAGSEAPGCEARSAPFRELPF